MKGIIGKAVLLLAVISAALSSIQVAASPEAENRCSASHSALVADLFSVCSELKKIDIENLAFDIPWLESKGASMNQKIHILGECLENRQLQNWSEVSFVHYMYENLIRDDINRLLQYEEMPRLEVLRTLMSIVVNLSGIVENCTLGKPPKPQASS